MENKTLIERLNDNLQPINRIVSTLEEASKRGYNCINVYGDDTLNIVYIQKELNRLGLKCTSSATTNQLTWTLSVYFPLDDLVEHIGPIPFSFDKEWPYCVQL